MSVLAHLDPLDDGQDDRRGAPRLRLSLGSVVGPCGSTVVIHDLSLTGLLFATSADLAAGETIEVELPEMRATQATIVWREGRMFGCRFEQPIPKAVVSAALLRSEPRSGNFGSDPHALGVLHRRHPVRLATFTVFAFAGVAYLLLNASLSTLLVIGAVIGLLAALLVAWGLWILDNTILVRPPAGPTEIGDRGNQRSSRS